MGLTSDGSAESLARTCCKGRHNEMQCYEDFSVSLKINENGCIKINLCLTWIKRYRSCTPLDGCSLRRLLLGGSLLIAL